MTKLRAKHKFWSITGWVPNVLICSHLNMSRPSGFFVLWKGDRNVLTTTGKPLFSFVCVLLLPSSGTSQAQGCVDCINIIVCIINEGQKLYRLKTKSIPAVCDLASDLEAAHLAMFYVALLFSL